MAHESFVDAIDIGTIPGGDHGADVESLLAQSAGCAHRGDRVRAGDRLAVDLVIALDDYCAVLRDDRALRDRSSQGGPQVGELAPRSRHEDDAVLMHAGHDGVETTWDAALAIEQGAIHVCDH